MADIKYRKDHPLDPLEVARVFVASGITRPTDDPARIARMFAAPCLVFSAWDGERLVGVSRSLTDYCYCCYLSDLAVDRDESRDLISDPRYASIVNDLRARVVACHRYQPAQYDRWAARDGQAAERVVRAF